jgi:hypothetical protein
MAVISVPRPPKKAYNPRRPPGALLQNQLIHLEWAVRPAAQRQPGAFKIKPAKTEAEAARRIGQLTEEIHRQATAPREPAFPPEAGPAKARPAKARPAKARPAKAGPANARSAKARPAKAGSANARSAKAGSAAKARSGRAPSKPRSRAASRRRPR